MSCFPKRKTRRGTPRGCHSGVQRRQSQDSTSASYLVLLLDASLPCPLTQFLLRAELQHLSIGRGHNHVVAALLPDQFLDVYNHSTRDVTRTLGSS